MSRGRQCPAWAAASSVSRSPYSMMSWAAALRPMPGTPGAFRGGTLALPAGARHRASAWVSITQTGDVRGFSRR